MNKWMKTLLCGVAAAALVACGGGDDTTTTATTGGGGSTAAPAAMTGLGEQGFAVAQFGVGAAVDGMIIPVAPFAPPTSLESPQAAPPQDPMDISSRCQTGSATQQQTGESTYQLVYTNCRNADSEATYNGVINVTAVNGMGEEDTDYTADFDSTGLTVTVNNNSKTLTFVYKNRTDVESHAMVMSNIVRSGNNITKVKNVMNVSINLGASSNVTLQDYAMTFDSTVNPETIDLSGKYVIRLKPSDFISPLPAGVPDMEIPLTFTVTTNPILKVGTGDGFSGGTLIMSDTTLGYKVETNFTDKKITITVAGQATTYGF